MLFFSFFFFVFFFFSFLLQPTIVKQLFDFLPHKKRTSPKTKTKNKTNKNITSFLLKNYRSGIKSGTNKKEKKTTCYPLTFLVFYFISFFFLLESELVCLFVCLFLLIQCFLSFPSIPFPILSSSPSSFTSFLKPSPSAPPNHHQRFTNPIMYRSVCHPIKATPKKKKKIQNNLSIMGLMGFRIIYP